MLETLKPAVLLPRLFTYRKLREYEEAYAAGRTEYGEILQVYRALERGKKVISVNLAMETAGINKDGSPVLAIANATARWCWFVRAAGRIYDRGAGGWNHPASAFVSDWSVNPGWRNRILCAERATKGTRFRFLQDFFPVYLPDELQARVPMVPPGKMPRKNAAMENYVILWEADWQKAPRDPLLLKRITREYFTVEAEWDLTDVERMLLETAAYAGE